MMAIHNGCRTSLLIAGVVLVPAIFPTLLSPCHPYFMEMIFSTCSTHFLMCAAYNKGGLYCIMHTNTKPVFIVQACILLS